MYESSFIELLEKYLKTESEFNVKLVEMMKNLWEFEVVLIYESKQKDQAGDDSDSGIVDNF